MRKETTRGKEGEWTASMRLTKLADARKRRNEITDGKTADLKMEGGTSCETPTYCTPGAPGGLKCPY